MTTADPNTTKAKQKAAGFGAAKGPDVAVVPASAPLKACAWLFALIVFGVPVVEIAVQLARGERVQALDYFAPIERGPDGRPLQTWGKELARELTSSERLRGFEHELEESSFLKRDVLPWYQSALYGLLRHGNKRTVPGRDGWLFFADDLESAYGRGYLEPGVGGQAALAAIDDFKAQLDARGIRLLLIPSYSKEMLDPDRLSVFTSDLKAAVNPDLPRFYEELERRGLPFIRMDELFAECRASSSDPSAPLALPRDTHWSPSTMSFCARRIAERATELLNDAPAPSSEAAAARFATRPRSVSADGDLVRMLGLPDSQSLLPPMQLELEQVVDAKSGAPAKSDPRADVLLMGDSLAQAFSNPSLGLGEASGLPEHLMLRMNRPLDVIALAGGSATATRDALARRDDGLAGKKLVIWQFGVRMLGAGPGEWRLVKLGGANPFGAPGPEDVGDVPADRVTIVGELVATSKIGEDFDYPFALAVHEYKVLEVIDGKVDGDRVWVAFPAIVAGKDQPARSFRPGTKHRMTLDDVRLHYDFEEVTMFDTVGAGRTIHYPIDEKVEEVR